MIVGTDDVLQHFHVADDAEEGEEGEDDEVFHRLGVILLGIAVFRLRKHDGFVSVAEGLSNHCHYHRYLHAGSVNAKLNSGFIGRMSTRIGVCPREDYLVECLIEDACNTEYEDWPRVGQHATQKGEIDFPMDMKKLRNEEEGDERRADKVEHEDVIDVVLAHRYEVEYVESDVQDDEEEFQSGKLNCLLTETKERERYGLDGIDGYANCHNLHVFGVGSLSEGCGYIVGEDEYTTQEYGYKRRYDCHRRREDGVVVLSLFVGKAEEGGLHTESEDDQDECHEGIEVGHYSVATVSCCYYVGVEGYEQVVEEPSEDGRHAIDGGILCKRF